MNLIDLLIIIVAIGAISRGVRLGLFRQFLSVAGFFGGLFVGSFLAPYLVGLSTDATMRALLTLSLTLGLALAFSGVGEYLGWRLRFWAERHNLSGFDAVLGAVFEVGTVLIAAWLLAAAATSLPSYSLGKVTRESTIIQSLNQALPPAPGVIARIGHLLSPNGFPKVFLGNEPAPSTANPNNPADVRAALASDGPSTVKIEGRGCGGIVVGSGFVVGDGYVATNAHVVAGVRRIEAIDASGRHAATPVWFDPDLDFAVLRVSGLSGPPLSLVSQIEPAGTSGVVLGYPGGGQLTAGEATILERTKALGRDIYDSRLTYRDIYQIQAIVEPGNSGGPLVLSDGRVIGIVFAKAVSNDFLGYALTSNEIIPGLSRAEAQNQPVGTGSCAD